MPIVEPESDASDSSEVYSKWSEVILGGKSYSDLINMDFNKLIKLVKESGLDNIISSDYVLRLNIDLQRYETRLFGMNSPNLITDIEVKDASMLLENAKLKYEYIGTLLDTNKFVYFISKDNFGFNKFNNRIATIDFRVLIDDRNGKVPFNKLLHVASVASLMLSGVISYPVGYEHITQFMRRYGYTNFTYQSNGYLHIELGLLIEPETYRIAHEVASRSK